MGGNSFKQRHPPFYFYLEEISNSLQTLTLKYAQFISLFQKYFMLL